MRNYRIGSRRHVIQQFMLQGLSASLIYQRCSELVRDQVRPFVFTANPVVKGAGRRTPKPMHEQYAELRHEISRVFAAHGRADDLDDVESPEAPEPEIPEQPERPVKKAKATAQSEFDFFKSEWQRLRGWISDRARSTGTNPIDDLAMRPLKDAAAAIARGIPARAMLYAMTMHWPDDARSDAGIENFDFMSASEPIPAENGRKFHAMAGYVLKLAQARIPIMLVGGAGVGKSHLASDIAYLLGELPYGETPMTAGATPSWLAGSYTLDGFKTRPFLEIYAGGGVFNFEEIDASDPNLLLLTNNALAGDRFFNPSNGERYDRSEQFVPMSTANTLGLGANRQFTGRERLDAATIDRWRMGRVFMELDENLAIDVATRQLEKHLALAK